MGDLLGEDDVSGTKNILYRCLDLLLDRKAALFSHLKSRRVPVATNGPDLRMPDNSELPPRSAAVTIRGTRWV
jgi:hypothetical protein